MMTEQGKRMNRALLTFFFLVLAIQSVHMVMNVPGYDFAYILIITFLLTLGVFAVRFRGVFFVIALFMMDLWPDWFLLFMAIFSFVLRNIAPVSSLNLKKLSQSEL